MTVHINGTDIYYEQTGTGRPLILVHGNGEDHTIFREAVDVLGEDFTCICPDSRGHGSSAPATELHYEDMADDMIALMEELDLRDAVFCGFSDGGIVGLLAAPRCGRISALITCGANLTPKGLKPGMRLLFRVMYLLKKDPLIRLMLDEPRISDGMLAGIKARTLVLAGSRDLIRRKETEHIARGIPGAEMKILGGEDHGSYIVHSEKITGLIREFAGRDRTEV